ncbi:PEP-CTERM putative exosortase interaction domain-containing protein [Nostoc sp. PCC 7524]|uniref:PEP-CTERM sorting domain-containing protein n=1 Tax=Nostoc sp. (strain ATCC 29411 / PCC 7524) TaxID=28072 RepID=UPI00029F2F4C|nr:PEP-CTERM sorting domain-containing protein [Nostoc sp. PCC 7524]AFY46131.1 PEP-CTERM putative exosortase interaction domain-containing protein [Nostoc sp. PCC 7524]
MTLAKNLGIASFAAAISIAAITAKPAQAAIVRYDFTVNPGESFGSFSFDDSTLTGLGLETIGVENGLDVTFNYLGTTYTEEDDQSYDFFPILTFNDGRIQGLSYGVLDQFFIGDETNFNIGGANFYVFDPQSPSSLIQTGTVSYSRVPEPLALGGTAIATTMGLFIKRKKKASSIAG